MFDSGGLSVKSPDAWLAFGVDRAADANAAQPASQNIDNFSSDHRLTQESISGLKAARPSHLSTIPTTEAPAPQSPVNTRAVQVAGSRGIALLSPSADACVACVESTLRWAMRVRLPTMSSCGGRFTD